jgi:hypothetical protein
MAIAIVAVYDSHGTIENITLGTAEGSLSILALVISLRLWTTNLDCSRCPNSMFKHWIVFVVLITTTILAIFDFHSVHFAHGLSVGTVEGSLSLLAFAVTATLWADEVQSICVTCNLRRPQK